MRRGSFWGVSIVEELTSDSSWELRRKCKLAIGVPIRLNGRQHGRKQQDQYLLVLERWAMVMVIEKQAPQSGLGAGTRFIYLFGGRNGIKDSEDDAGGERQSALTKNALCMNIDGRPMRR